MRKVTARCEVVGGGGKVLERYSFQRASMAPGDEWEVIAPIHNNQLLTMLKSNQGGFGYHRRIIAERRHWGPIHFIYRWEDQPGD